MLALCPPPSTPPVVGVGRRSEGVGGGVKVEAGWGGEGDTEEVWVGVEAAEAVGVMDSVMVGVEVKVGREEAVALAEAVGSRVGLEEGVSVRVAREGEGGLVGVGRVLALAVAVGKEVVVPLVVGEGVRVAAEEGLPTTTLVPDTVGVVVSEKVCVAAATVGEGE